METFTLSGGWNEEKAVAFTKAVEQVVVENPLLASHLVWKKSALCAIEGTYPPDKHTFVTMVEDASVDIQGLKTHRERLDFIDTLSSRLGRGHKQKLTTEEDIKTRHPLFHAHLFRFRDGHACYHVELSHALGDAQTYYRIIDQISSFMNDAEHSKADSLGESSSC